MLKFITNYIQKTYSMVPNYIVKATQQPKCPALDNLEIPTKAKCVDTKGHSNDNECEMAKITWQAKNTRA